MANFVPKAFRKKQVFPACVDVAALFSEPRFAATVERVLSFLHRVYLASGDGSYERTGRPGVITEVFFVCMPTCDAYTAEIELCNAMWGFSLGELNEEKIKVYLNKYLDTHTFVYRETSKNEWTQEFKTGYSKRTGPSVPLYSLDYGKIGTGHVCNEIQVEILKRLEAKSGNNVRCSVSKI